MKISCFIFCLIPLFASAKQDVLNDGLYYAYFVHGTDGNYKLTELMANKPNKINGVNYFINDINLQSNDEVYLMVNDEKYTFFYKHDQIEGGPVIGWANAIFSENKLTVESPTVKDFYSDSSGGAPGKNIKYKVESEFSGVSQKVKYNELVPLQNVSPDAFKVDCNDYFKLNLIGNDYKPFKNDPMAYYDDRVFMNYNGLCNVLLGESKLKDGWILFKKIN